NFSYYDSLFTRRPEDANAIILDNLLWTANIDNNANVLWLLLSQRRDIIVSSSTEQWKEALKKIVETIPEFPHELPKAVHPETLNHDGFSYVLTDGVKQIAALKTIPLPSKQGKFRTAFMKYPNNMIMIGSYSLADIDRQMTKYRKVLAIAFGSVLLISGGLGFYITRRAMLGVQRVTRTAMSIGQGDLSCRVTVGHQGREIEDMATAFNDMLGRIQVLIKELK
ncbi:MAG: HAMP domain-containing protein, partial [Phycisphaerales bacterium]